MNVYFLGGIEKGQHITTIEEIDPKDKSSKIVPNVKINDINGLNGHASVVCEGTIYTLGGCDGER